MTLDVPVLICGMLLLAVLVEPWAERLRLPFSTLLVLIGFLSAELIVALGFDTGLRWQSFSHLILHVLVPVLVFESAFNMNAKVLLKNIAPVLFLAVPVMLLAALLSGTLLYFGVGHPEGFPWIAALLAGTLLSATDPVAVVAMFKRLGAPERLTALLEGESLFNDATAVVLYMLLINIILTPGESPGIGSAIITFLYTFLGGLLIGLLCGALLAPLYTLLRNHLCRATLSVVTAIITYYIAEHLLHISGIVALLAAGLLLGEVHRRNDGQYFVNNLWEFNAYITNALIFLMSGMTITWLMFSSRWLAMLIGIGAILLVRAIAVYGLLSLFTLTPRIQRLTLAEQNIMVWGGLRGAVTLALALSLPTDIESWFTIQSIAYGVVLFTLFIQAPTMAPLINRSLKNQ